MAEVGSSSPVTKGRGHEVDAETRIVTETVRRLARNKGGDYEMLTILKGQQPGDAAQSIEGWVLAVTNLAPETTEGDLISWVSSVELPSAENVNVRVRNSRLLNDRQSGQCIGHALVELRTREEAEAVVIKLNNTPFLSSEAVQLTNAFVVPEFNEFEELSAKQRKRGRHDDNPQGEEEDNGKEDEE